MKAPWPSALLLLVAAAATDDAPLEHAVRSAMRREPGWDAALSLALLRDDCDANALVDADGAAVTALFAAARALADGADEALPVALALLARGGVDVNRPARGREGDVISPVFVVVAAASAGGDAALALARALLAHERLDLRAAEPRAISLLGYALSACGESGRGGGRERGETSRSLGDEAETGRPHTSSRAAARARAFFRYASGELRGLAVAKLLLARDDVDVNGLTLGEDGSKVTPLGALVSAVARGGSAALEFARLFLARGDVDLRAAETLGDGARGSGSWGRVGDEAEAPLSLSLQARRRRRSSARASCSRTSRGARRSPSSCG